jgi:hypothetical protein
MIDAAAPGDTVIVPAGTWTAPIHIDKPLTLEGQAWPVIQGDGSGDVIRITSPDVTVRGLLCAAPAIARPRGCRDSGDGRQHGDRKQPHRGRALWHLPEQARTASCAATRFAAWICRFHVAATG